MRHVTPILLLVVLAVVVFPAQAQDTGPQAVGLRPDAPEYAKHGPFWVGTSEFVIPDPDDERPLALTVWYPALNPDGDLEEITYTADYPPVAPALSIPGHALLNASPDANNGPYPLVIFSHGAWSTRYEGVDFTEHLASYGFVVAAPDHTGNTFSEWGQDLSLFNVLRPQDVLRVIGYAEELTRQDATLKGLINTDLIAITGHSFGGWTALAAAGAQLDLEAYQTWCGQNPQSDPLGIGICSSFLDHTDDLASLAGLQSVPEGLWPAIADPRIDAAVALAPGGPAAFGQDGLTSVPVPVMIFAGSSDFITPSQYHADFAYDYLVSPKALVTLVGASHFVYQNACTANPMAVADINQFITCSDPVWDMNRAHDLINHLTTAFLLDVLKGDSDAHQALLPEAVQFTGIEYQTTMDAFTFMQLTAPVAEVDVVNEFPTGEFVRECPGMECKMVLNNDGSFTYSLDDVVYASGTYRIDGNQFIWVIDDSCEEVPMAYTWSYADNALTLTEVEFDPCPNRRRAVNGVPHAKVDE